MSGADRTLIRAIRGPITLITVGVLFALNNFTPYDFSKTWPILLIVFGMLSLMRRATAPAPLPVPPQQQPPIPTYPRYDYPPPPGGYAQTAYPTPEPTRPGEPKPGDPR